MSEAAPRADRLVVLADQCVQCGLCLPACPTYSLERIEAESPRGRIALARAWALDLAEPTATGDAHLDQCLGCRRCEAVCPAGVQYGPLLIEARARQRERRGVGWHQRLLEWLAMRPARMTQLLALYRIAFPLLPEALRKLPQPPAPDFPQAREGAKPAKTSVALFVGCVATAYEASLRDAVARLCAALDIEVVQPVEQGCCGALHAHAGNIQSADALAVRNRAAFADCAQVITLASGCHEAVADALGDNTETSDAIDFLARHDERLRFRDTRQRIALHLPCTQRNVVRSDLALRGLLARVPGLEIIELDAGHGCCGAAGSNMLTDPARAAEFRAPLLEQLRDSSVERLLSANIGCRLHLAGGTALPVQHPLEFLADCLVETREANLTAR